MMFAPGDLVVCVDAHNAKVECWPEAVAAFARLTVGRYYRVIAIGADELGHVGIDIGIRNADICASFRDIWPPFLFRKIDPLADLDTRAAGKTFKLPAKPVIDPARHSRELAK